MKIKSSLNLIRGILYLYEIIRCKSISRAAEENGIKASNLSLIINNLEKQIGVRLLKRSSLGCTPTQQGIKLAQYAVQLSKHIQTISAWDASSRARKHILNIYISPNMEICDYREFEALHPNIILNFVEEDILADIKLSNTPPLNPQTSCTELHIGTGITQKIWICCNEENPNALEFFDFITAKLLLLYDQSTPLSSESPDRLCVKQSKTDG